MIDSYWLWDRSYFPGLLEWLVFKGHRDRINNTRPAVDAFSSKHRVDLLLFDPQLVLLLLHHDILPFLLLLNCPKYIELPHKGKPVSLLLEFLLCQFLLFLLTHYSILNDPDLVWKHIDLLKLVPIECGVRLYRVIQTVAVEPMHARENVKLLVEQSLEALLAFVTGVYFNATIFYHPQLLF